MIWPSPPAVCSRRHALHEDEPSFERAHAKLERLGIGRRRVPLLRHLHARKLDNNKHLRWRPALDELPFPTSYEIAAPILRNAVCSKPPISTEESFVSNFDLRDNVRRRHDDQTACSKPRKWTG